MTLPGFWPTIHAGDVKIVRDNIHSVKERTILLESGTTIEADLVAMCTGWGDHFAMFDDETKEELGLPAYGKMRLSEKRSGDVCWEEYDNAADEAVTKKLPFLSQAPTSMNAHTNDLQPHRRWRLYRRSIPIQLALEGDRSLAILGQIHTVQTPLVADMQSFWSILYLIGATNMPSKEVMAQEIAEWNAWTRKRYLSQGEKFPYSLYDFLPVSQDSLTLSHYLPPDWAEDRTLMHSHSTLIPCVRTWASTRVGKAIRLRRHSRLTNRMIFVDLLMNISRSIQTLYIEH